METQEELRAHLLQTDTEFQRLAAQHSEYHQRLEAIEAKQPLTPLDEEEETRLKKLKLHLKDQMNQIVLRHS